MQQRLLALYGLKFNPFTSDIPTEALYASLKFNNFCWRIEHTLIKEGGYALICGEPGTGKSANLRLLMENLKDNTDVQVGVITHPSARVGDFYRELGDIYGVPLSVHNRWNSFKSLRERWLQHLQNTLIRPVLFIDEAQEVPIAVFSELRLLASMQLDSRTLLSVVLSGDHRLLDKLRRDDLMPLASRIRIRLTMEYAESSQLMQTLEHLLESAGNSNLMTDELKQTLCEHAMGNYRVLSVMAGELLDLAAQKEYAKLDEKLYHECFATQHPSRKKTKS